MGCANGKDKPIGATNRFPHLKPRQTIAPDIKTYKLVFLGRSGVGKTSVLMRYAQEVFHTSLDPTIGAVFSTKTLTTPDGNTLTLEMWDTAGQERFKAMMPIYYRVADAAVLVYDITSKESFAEVNYWYKELRQQVSDCNVFVAGNKVDREEYRQISLEEASKFCKVRNLDIMELSSKTGDNVNEFFTNIAIKLSGRLPKKEQVEQTENGEMESV